MKDARICPSCGGTLDDRSLQIDFRYKGRLIVVEGIPAQVCKDCGEQLVSASTSKDIDALLKSGAKPSRQITVPVLPFRRSAQA